MVEDFSAAGREPMPAPASLAMTSGGRGGAHQVVARHRPTSPGQQDGGRQCEHDDAGPVVQPQALVAMGGVDAKVLGEKAPERVEGGISGEQVAPPQLDLAFD